MGISDTIDNKYKHIKSERKEKKDIELRSKDVKELSETAADEIFKLGQYFWKKYIEGEYVPDESNKVIFDNLDRINDRVMKLHEEIQDVKINAVNEREEIDEETRRRIRDKINRKEEKAEARALKKADKGKQD